MQKLKNRWDITHNYQLIFLLIGIIGLLACGYTVARLLLPSTFEDAMYEFLFVIGVGAILAYLFYRFCIWVFPRLMNKWNIKQRWQMVVIFIVFAITGSVSARISGPFIELIGLDRSTVSAWVFWPLRLLIIFPIYQVMLVVVGWCFGQFKFFWWFEKKMLSRFGIKL